MSSRQHVTQPLSPAHTRAWIETTSAIPTSRRYLVARSHAGVDRNHICHSDQPSLSCRPLTRGRGSKLLSHPPTFKRTNVARSHAGVDRNRLRRPSKDTNVVVARSHAGVDRNLSHSSATNWAASRPLTRGRGSKPTWEHRCKGDAASPAHTRAWIETA